MNSTRAFETYRITSHNPDKRSLHSVNGELPFVLTSKQTLFLPKPLRHTLRTPIGRLIYDQSQLKRLQHAYVKKYESQQNKALLICVGDVVTQTIMSWDHPCDFFIIDGMSQRKALNNSTLKSSIKRYCYMAPNSPGTLEYQAVSTLNKMISTGPDKAIKKGLFIIGEEDLLTLPAIVFAPLGSIVLYGQRDVGMIAVPVTERKKKQVERLLHAFST